MNSPSERIEAVRNSGLLDVQGQSEFQDIIEVVKAGLRCPVALISILDEHRQVFIAHLGLPEKWAEAAETPLTHSFCQHVVRDKAPLIIGDATLHDLVRDNLAITDLGVISYMGVPVTMPDGMVIGALAAIDGEPRTWTESELELLSRIGRVASNQIATFLSERRWGALFEQLEEGIVVGSVIRDLDGTIIDWRYETINPAWSVLLGIPGDDVPGQTMRGVFPDLEEAWISDVAQAMETRQSKRFTRRVGLLDRWFDGYVQATGEDKFVIIFVDVTDRMQAIEALRNSETKLRLIVEGAKDYIILTLDEDQRITSWFGGAEETFGWSETEMLGRPFEEMFTEEDRAASIPQLEIETAARDGVAPDRRWHLAADGTRVFLDGTMRPLPNHSSSHLSGFIKVARNATAQKLSQDRQLAFLELGEKIREVDTVAEVAFAAAEIMARNLQGATRAGYGIVDPIAETVEILPDWRATGMFTVAGLHYFRDYGSYIEDLKRGELIIISDVATDPRTSDSAELLNSLGISVLVNVPILERGAFVGVMFVHYEKPHEFSPEERDFVRTIADRTREAIARIRAEQDQQVLNHEISHRLKNTMAMVQAIATQTLRPVTDRAPVEAFTNRLHALSKAHEVLLNHDWSNTRMMTVIDPVLRQLSLPDRYRLSGVDLEVGPRTALSLALLMHELGTNALKYGAWSSAAGSVVVTWEIQALGGESTLVLEWNEKDGPPVVVPSGKGFGSKLIRLGLMGNGGVEIDYDPDGVRVTMHALVSQLGQ
ncbi:GAF domain-containing protein [Agrobacterium tumefaciens]|uniref:GAF domain-containing protein n=1 Tax=Agrobacterium tumefaciens TaxID=358 RepID=UPI00287DC1D0|nr:GAF domain-containing protein [Agrobacterium tumefaciens]MDS7594653.1 GAF domain-containing protein [Agrobacterium tumefaciens]